LEVIAPANDQVEVSLFGPGYGECIVVHVRNDEWVIVDSCINSATGRPVAIDYLNSLGVDTQERVALIVATHWHDDHVRGMAQVLQACGKAEFVVSTAVAAKEFVAMARARRHLQLTSVSSGVDELYQIYDDLKGSSRSVTRAIADRPIKVFPSTALGHGHECLITSLSPSDEQVQISLDDISHLMPSTNETEERCVPRGPNHLAVALWFSIGPVNLLFGADLEETANPKTGWTIIVKSATRPSGKAGIFKVPHHGSQNGHSPDVWSELLDRPVSILTPYVGGRTSLPKTNDLQRILGLSSEAFATARNTKIKSSARRPAGVDRTLKDFGINVTVAQPRTGHVRLRNGGKDDFETWSTELFSGAYKVV
jgi:beta-lactamase superfamily II metal-dependent hydrolase